MRLMRMSVSAKMFFCNFRVGMETAEQVTSELELKAISSEGQEASNVEVTSFDHCRWNET